MSDPVEVLTMGEVAREAARCLNVYGGGRTDIVKTGLGPVDREIGGLFGGAVGILAMDTGVGKSSMVLAAALASPHRVGIISAEDFHDVVGSRALAARSGVSSLRMRRPGELTERDQARIRAAEDELAALDRILWYFPARKSVESIRNGVQALAVRGAEIVWLDYIQKFRGTGHDRRNEVGAIFTAFQEECQTVGIPGMAVSQFRRRENHRQPMLSDLKESGDLENECRLAILGWADLEQPTRIVNCRIAKSTYGGQGKLFQYWRDDSGTLREEVWDEAPY